jgi:hypothetical protein
MHLKTTLSPVSATPGPVMMGVYGPTGKAEHHGQVNMTVGGYKHTHNWFIDTPNSTLTYF